MNREFTLNNIGKAKLANSVGLSLLLVAVMATHALSQTILIDDFDDGDADGWSTIDTTVGQPYGPGTFDASSGAYHLDTPGVVPGPGLAFLFSTWDQSSHPIFSDGFLRAKVRAETQGTIVSLALRLSGSLETGLNGYVFFGTTHQGGRFLFNKIVNGRNVQTKQIPGNFSFGVNEDWYIEAGAVGNQISMKAWRVDDQEPEFPQLTFTDRTHSTGDFGAESSIHDSPFAGPARVSAIFDDVHFTFPEHDDVFTVSPYNIYLWEPPMPVPQVEGPFFVSGSPEKPDMRGDIVSADAWPDLYLTGQVTDFDGRPIPGLKLDFWQVDDQGSYDNTGGYNLRGHTFTDTEGNYELWTVMPAAYETIRTRHLHLKIGGENLGFRSPVYTTQLYLPAPYDNDIDADGIVDKVVEGGVQTDFDAIALEEDFIAMADLAAVGAEFSDLAGNIMTLNNDPSVDGYFDATLNIVMPQVFQSLEKTVERTLIDDFDDGNANGWTTIDTTVGQPYGPGIFDASSGAYHFEGGGLAQAGGSSVLAAAWDESSDPIFSDGFVRAKVRCETQGGTAGILLRGSGNLETGFNDYAFFGTTHLGGRFLYNKVVNGQTVQDTRLPGNFRFGVNEDWYIEAGAVGDQLSMKVWRVGAPEPQSPQLTFTDSAHRTGQFGVYSNIHASPFPGPARVSATFDDIYFTFPGHDDVFAVSPYNIYLWESPMPIPQVEGPFFTAGSPLKPDMRGDVRKADGWPDLHLTGHVADLDGQPMPGLKLDFWQTDDQGSYDNSGGYALRGHVFTDTEGNYELWTVIPAAYETIRTRHLHLKIGGANLGFSSPVYTTQLYLPAPYDNDINADGIPDKVIEGGVQMDFDAIALEEDFITMADLAAVGGEPTELAGNIMTVHNDPLADGHFDATLNIVMPQVFQAYEKATTERN